jgi:uncharacterized repeat protein (TIGR03803 family)
MQSTNGAFYGVTAYGGESGLGTVFSLSVGLGRFVQPLPSSGAVGTVVKILGTRLTGATSVTFNGTTAPLQVVSSTEITTAVPPGATSGTIVVTTPTGNISSNVAFQVP